MSDDPLACLDQGVTAEKLGSVLKISAGRVRGLAQKGIFPRVGRLFHARDSIAGYIGYLKSQATPAKRRGGSDIDVERTRLYKAQADEKELQVEELAGRLVDADEVLRLGAGMVTAARNKLLGVHSAIRSKYTDLDHEIVEDIARLHREALEALGDDGIPDPVSSKIKKSKAPKNGSKRPRA